MYDTLSQDLATNRPVVATINMCPRSLKDTSPDQAAARMMHEVWGDEGGKRKCMERD